MPVALGDVYPDLRHQHAVQVEARVMLRLDPTKGGSGNKQTRGIVPAQERASVFAGRAVRCLNGDARRERKAMRSIENPLRLPRSGSALLAGASAHAADMTHRASTSARRPRRLFVVQAPPRLVVVPEVPGVQYAPDLSFNYFAYGGRYYTFNNGAWFVAAAPGAPWGYVPLERVPGPLRGGCPGTC